MKLGPGWRWKGSWTTGGSAVRLKAVSAASLTAAASLVRDVQGTSLAWTTVPVSDRQSGLLKDSTWKHGCSWWLVEADGDPGQRSANSLQASLCEHEAQAHTLHTRGKAALLSSHARTLCRVRKSRSLVTNRVGTWAAASAHSNMRPSMASNSCSSSSLSALWERGPDFRHRVTRRGISCMLTCTPQLVHVCSTCLAWKQGQHSDNTCCLSLHLPVQLRVAPHTPH